jgi:hypothetical protein
MGTTFIPFFQYNGKNRAVTEVFDLMATAGELL